MQVLKTTEELDILVEVITSVITQEKENTRNIDSSIGGVGLLG